MACEVTVQDVQDRLAVLGFPTAEADVPQLSYTLEKAAQYIRNDCNISEVPQALRYALIDLAAADHLLARKAVSAAGEDAVPGFEQAVKTIQEGDTTVTYMTAGEGGNTPESRLDGFIMQIRGDALAQLLPFRRLTW